MVSMLDIIADYFDIAGWRFARLDGSMAYQTREIEVLYTEIQHVKSNHALE